MASLQKNIEQGRGEITKIDKSNQDLRRQAREILTPDLLSYLCARALARLKKPIKMPITLKSLPAEIKEEICRAVVVEDRPICLVENRDCGCIDCIDLNKARMQGLLLADKEFNDMASIIYYRENRFNINYASHLKRLSKKLPKHRRLIRHLTFAKPHSSLPFNKIRLFDLRPFRGLKAVELDGDVGFEKFGVCKQHAKRCATQWQAAFLISQRPDLAVTLKHKKWFRLYRDYDEGCIVWGRYCEVYWKVLLVDGSIDVEFLRYGNHYLRNMQRDEENEGCWEGEDALVERVEPKRQGTSSASI